ncbi:MAG: PilN domain-containing protein [Bradymonadales bacterium]|nr:PilN domain-containing protein [Bradymonadales bacterium]
MIRINLLPVRQAKKRETGRQQLVLFLFLVVLEVVVLFLIYNTKKQELTTITEEVERIRQEIRQVGELEGQIAQLDAEKAELVSVRLIMEDLQANRIGPGGVMDELKYLLNRWSSEREMAIQEARGWAVNWDPRMVWLSQVDINPSSFRLQGVARSGEDVAEFLLRLESRRPDRDSFFIRPEVPRYSAANDPYLGQVMQFSISGGIRYQPMAGLTN